MKPFKGVIKALKQSAAALLCPGRRGQKCKGRDSVKGWRELAHEYYFESHLQIKDIEMLIGVSRQSISAYLKTCKEFREEKERRKDRNRERRREYKAEKNREYRRMVPMGITQETVQREHEMAVRELSRERYH